MVAISCICFRNGYGQSFVNLDFEDATIVPDPSSPYYPSGVYAGSAIPGWTAAGLTSPNDILYDDASLGATSVTLCGTNSPYSHSALDGLFSIELYGGVEGPAAGASISQTGLVPANAASLRFVAAGVSPPAGGLLLVSLGGQYIAISAISSGPNYTLYDGNIAPFAGQVKQLTFTVPQGINNIWDLDDIQFSSIPVPEPGAGDLFVIGWLMFRRTFAIKRLGRAMNPWHCEAQACLDNARTAKLKKILKMR